MVCTVGKSKAMLLSGKALINKMILLSQEDPLANFIRNVE
jgi:hypothetical protein